MLRDRTIYMPIADDEALNGAVFRGGTWHKLSSNCDHFVASRGRVVVKDGPCIKKLAAADTAVTREYVFDRREQENVLYARATWGIRTGSINFEAPVTMTWRIDTDDTTGTHGNAGEDSKSDRIDLLASRADNFRRYFPGSAVPCQWPEQLGATENNMLWPIQSEWQKHTIPATTNLPGTVVEVVFQTPDEVTVVLGIRQIIIVAAQEIAAT